MGAEEKSYKIFNNLLFPKIFRTFRTAIQPTKLIIALMAVAVICLVGWIMDFSKTVAVTPGTQGEITELQIYMAHPDQVQSYIEVHKGNIEHKGVFSTLWDFSTVRFKGAINSLFAFNLPAVATNIAECFKAARWALRYHYIYSIIFFIIKLAVICIAGGAICRIAALQFAKGEKPGFTEALHFSIKKFISFFTAPIAPIGIIIFIGLFIFVLGLIGNIPRLGELIMGIFMLLAVLAGTLIAVVLIGTVAGFNLMFPAIAYDGSDCFDSVSRSFSYVYSKPWQMGFYTAIAAVYGAICYTFVRFFAFLLLWASRWFLQLGVWVDSNSKEVNKLAAIWPEPTFVDLYNSSGLTAANWSESFAAFLVYLVSLLVIGLVVSFIISFYFSANTLIYSLMRKQVDNTALDDIYTPADETKSDSTTIESEPDEVPPESDTSSQSSALGQQ